MSVQMIYETYLRDLSVEERLALIRLLVEETIPSAGMSVEDKMQLGKKLRAEAAQEQWTSLSDELPDVPESEVSMDDIVAEVKATRQLRKKQNH